MPSGGLSWRAGRLLRRAFALFDMFVANSRPGQGPRTRIPADKGQKWTFVLARAQEFPFAQEWDVADPRNIDFIWHTAFVFADVWGVPKSDVTVKRVPKSQRGS